MKRGAASSPRLEATQTCPGAHALPQPHAASGGRPLHQVFAARAAEQPDALALACSGVQWTYRELEERSNQLAHRLRRLGAGPESLVGVYLERSCDTVLAILAVLKAGAAYVPMDVAYPAERIAFMLEDAKPVVTITEDSLAANLPAGTGSVLALGAAQDRIDQEPMTPPRSEAHPQNAAYVIYTSGSTGKPKGVVVTHHNVVRLFESTQHWFRFSPDDVWTLFHSFAFDFSVWEMWGALLYGGRLVIVPYRVSRSPETFRELLVREHVTILNQTPSAFRQLIWADQAADSAQKLNLRWIIFGGEALDLQSLRPWLERHGHQQPALVNMYGITETTVHVTYRPITFEDVIQGRGSVIGQPIPDLSLHVLDERLQPCPAGVPGEICVGGAGVARGYLNRPELTRERFIPDPFSPHSGDRLYRSGDLAKRLPDGDLEYLGRADLQVKIRGFRIELGEVESALNTHPSVRASAVVAQTDSAGDKHLVAYLVCGPERPSREELRAHVRATLPEYMVPATFVFMNQLPLTVNGKVDRKALPAPEQIRPELSMAYAPPSTAEEKKLSAIWADVLQLDRVGVHDNFFALGGDSIRSIRVLARAQEQGLPISLEQLFAHPTIAELARADGRQGVERTPLPATRFALVSANDRARLPEGLEDAYPMARLQVGMVYHSSLDPESAIFHDVFSFRFALPWDEPKLRAAAARLVENHAILRTSFDLGTYSEPLQLRHRNVAVPLTADDLRPLGPEAQKAELVAWVEEEKRRPFDWSSPPFLRLHLQRYQEGVFQLIVSFHHAIMDGWSLAAMLTELIQDYTALLAGQPPKSAAPTVSYRDFVALEREALRSGTVREYWQRRVADPPVHALPRWPAGYRRGGKEQVRGPEFHIDQKVFAGLKRLANRTGVPLRTVLLAAHCHVMSFVTGQGDLMTGLVCSGRPQTAGGERMIGLFLNTVPFRISLKGGTWRELAAQTFAAERELLPNRRCPLAEIQEMAGGQHLFESVFDFVQFHVYRELPGYTEHTFLEDHYFEANNFPFYLTCMVNADGTQLQVHCDYDPNELAEPQIRAWCEYYVNTLAAMGESAEGRYEDWTPLSANERERLLSEWNKTAQAFPDCCVHKLIEAQASSTPQAVAARFSGRALTYSELNQQADSLSAHLCRLGVGPGVLVGTYLPRSLEMLVSVLAVLKSGGAYVPLDPGYPEERLEFMIADAQLGTILTTRALKQPLREARVHAVMVDEVLRNSPEAQPNAPTLAVVRPEDLAYVIYTSGSTGKPKGVQVTHRSLVNLLTSTQREPGMTAEDRLLAVTTLSFDIAGLELFLPLVAGGSVTIADSETTLNPAALAAAISAEQATILQATPTTWRILVDSGWPGKRDLKALCGGEALTRELANQLADRCAEVWNMYGPTETTIWSCLQRVELGHGPVPIGRPIANTEVYVLDGRRRPVPVGSEGEIWIGGQGLAAGYLRRPELTAERFISHPFRPGTGARLYCTGDRGSYLPDGTLLCHGRADQQVKIRGFRIELGEIEAVLAQHAALSSAVVSAKDEGSAGKRLVAYYVAKPGVTVTAHELRSHLERQLPAYMVPAAFVELEQLPLTPNGKIDRQHLPEPKTAGMEATEAIVPPRTPLEEQVARIWREVLGVDRLGIQDNFFSLGGHSLLAIQVTARLRRQLHVEISPARLFENPTVEGFTLCVLQALLEREPVADLAKPAADQAEGEPVAPGTRRHFEPVSEL